MDHRQAPIFVVAFCHTHTHTHTFLCNSSASHKNSKASRWDFPLTLAADEEEEQRCFFHFCKTDNHFVQKKILFHQNKKASPSAFSNSTHPQQQRDTEENFFAFIYPPHTQILQLCVWTNQQQAQKSLTGKHIPFNSTYEGGLWGKGTTNQKKQRPNTKIIFSQEERVAADQKKLNTTLHYVPPIHPL